MSETESIVLKSSAPISSTSTWAKWAYLISLLLVVAGGIGVIGLIGTFIVEHYKMSFHRDRIRNMKFKFVDTASPDDIYNKIQTLKTQYGNKLSFDRNGDTISVKYDSVIYDINVNDDATFCIWWRKSLAGAIFSWNNWKFYRKIRTFTPVIAYELQKQFGVI